MWHTTQTAGGDDFVPICWRMPYNAFFLTIIEGEDI
jgi:hypothetical protein